MNDKYFVFVYEEYYPNGGFDDLAGIFDSEEDALADIAKRFHKLDVDHIEVWRVCANDSIRLYWGFLVIDDEELVRYVLGDKNKIIFIGLQFKPCPKSSDWRSEPMSHYDIENAVDLIGGQQ